MTLAEFSSNGHHDPADPDEPAGAAVDPDGADPEAAFDVVEADEAMPTADADAPDTGAPADAEADASADAGDVVAGQVDAEVDASADAENVEAEPADAGAGASADAENVPADAEAGASADAEGVEAGLVDADAGASADADDAQAGLVDADAGASADAEGAQAEMVDAESGDSTDAEAGEAGPAGAEDGDTPASEVEEVESAGAEVGDRPSAEDPEAELVDAEDGAPADAEGAAAELADAEEGDVAEAGAAEGAEADLAGTEDGESADGEDAEAWLADAEDAEAWLAEAEADVAGAEGGASADGESAEAELVDGADSAEAEASEEAANSAERESSDEGEAGAAAELGDEDAAGAVAEMAKMAEVGEPRHERPAAESTDGAPAAEPADPSLDLVPAVAAAPVVRRADRLTLRQLVSALVPVLVVLLIGGAAGFGVGALRGPQEVVRREFVYTLTESVPDGFLREDRRLLTQIVTLESDAVLAPVAAEFGLEVDELRSRIDIETVDLSEVLRLEVSDGDRARALDLSQAIIDQYLVVSSRPLPSDTSESLRARRTEVVTALAEADASLLELQQARSDDVRLQTEEESLDRQIERTNDQINRLQGLLDESLASGATRGRSQLQGELASAAQTLIELEADLAEVRIQRASLAEQTAGESALVREIDRLEADLSTIDEELARRDLGPLVASPVRALSEPTFLTRSTAQLGTQGAAAGVLIALPLAGWLFHRARKRKLWLDR